MVASERDLVKQKIDGFYQSQLFELGKILAYLQTQRKDFADFDPSKDIQGFKNYLTETKKHSVVVTTKAMETELASIAEQKKILEGIYKEVKKQYGEARKETKTTINEVVVSINSIEGLGKKEKAALIQMYGGDFNSALALVDDKNNPAKQMLKDLENRELFAQDILHSTKNFANQTAQTMSRRVNEKGKSLLANIDKKIQVTQEHIEKMKRDYENKLQRLDEIYNSMQTLHGDLNFESDKLEKLILKKDKKPEDNQLEIKQEALVTVIEEKKNELQRELNDLARSVEMEDSSENKKD